MIRPEYNYKGIPIKSGARNVYRPGRGALLPASVKTVLRVIAVLAFLIFIVWGINSVLEYFHTFFVGMTQDSEIPATPAEHPAESRINEAETVETVKAPADKTAMQISQKDTVEKSAVQADRNVVEKPEAEVPKKKVQQLTQEQFMAWRKAEAYLRKKEYEKARAQLQQIFLWLSADHPMYPYTQKLLEQASEALRKAGAFSKISITEYEVKRGDLFSKIAAKNGIPLDVLRQANPQISNPNRLTLGQKVHIPKNKWQIDLSPKTQKLYVYDGSKLVRVYSLKISKVPVRLGNFIISEHNDEWNLFGLSPADIQNLNEYVPAGTLVRLER